VRYFARNEGVPELRCKWRQSFGVISSALADYVLLVFAAVSGRRILEIRVLKKPTHISRALFVWAVVAQNVENRRDCLIVPRLR
jgi:hypothetical protein